MFKRAIAFEIPGGYNESSYVMGRDSMRFAQIAVRVWSWRMSQAHTGGVSVALGYADCEQPAAKPRKADYIVKV